MSQDSASEIPPDLPVVNLEGRPRDRRSIGRIAAQLDRALSEIGFCYVCETAVRPELLADVFAASRAFHALSDAEKLALAINEHHRGYIAPASSKLVTSSVANVTKPNLSESFIVMNEIDRADPDYGRPLMGENQWPEVSGFKAACTAYMSAMRDLCEYLTRLIEEALGLEAEYLKAHFVKPTTWLRLLHYPSPPDDTPADQYGAAPHSDYGYLTVLAQHELGGLEVRTRNQTWLPVPPQPGHFVLNVGDMLERWTDGRWPSTPHRVRNEAGRSRYSLPFFYDPHLDTVIERLPGMEVQTDRNAVVYRDYLLERLNRNYNYRQNAASAAPT